MLGLEGNQSFVTVTKDSMPKVDDPVRRFVESAIGARHT